MIRTVPETGSTSADLAALLRAGEFVAEGDWLVADRQTSGRGRQGREWLDDAGNFMGSTVVHPRLGDPPAPTLSLVAGLAVIEAIRTSAADNNGLASQLLLKWPNDVMIGSAKLAGILLEREGEAVVVGIGLNLVAAPLLPDRETIALASLGAAPDRDGFATALARSFELEIERWRNFGLAPIVGRWAAAAHPLGTPLSVSGTEDGLIEGVFAGLADDGALQLRLADGSLRAVHAGEVHLAAPR